MNNLAPSLQPLEFTPALEHLLHLSLEEDIGPGDVTSQATISADQPGAGRIFAKQSGVLCGVDVARRVMAIVDESVEMETVAQDGQRLEPGMDIARLRGPIRSILTAERLMLNFLQRMSGVASLTRQFVDALRTAGSKIQVCDTRKTTPIWRTLEKYAVLAGGGVNHRFALYDMYLIKNNHIDAAGSVEAALRGVYKHNKSNNTSLPVSVEARNIAEVEAILTEGADLILLDNMPREDMARAAELIAGRAQTEITGGVTLETVSSFASLPINRVSIGALTHSAPALDISLHVA